MKAGDGTGGQISSRESWLSAPLSDPNAALWASITPPANPNLATIVRRRAAAFSLDLLAQRLYLRFPSHFSSRAPARIAILVATAALGAAVGALGYLGFGPSQAEAVAPVAAPEARATPSSVTAPSAPTRQGQTQMAAPAPGPALATTAPPAATERLVQPLRALEPPAPSADSAEASVAPAKAKRAAPRKRSKAGARRASRRRASASAD